MRKYQKTMIGSTILLVLLMLSLLYPYYGPKDFNHKIIVTNEQGDVIGRAPFPPSEKHLLGTDRNGEDMHLLILYGAKFTLITAFAVAILRVLVGGALGMFLSLWVPSLKSYIQDVFIIFRYIPAILLGLILMMPIAGEFNDVAITSIVTYQIIILVFIGIPSVMMFASDVIEDLLKTTYVQSSYLMGAGKWHIIRRQLMPHIRSYGILFTVQQIISTLHITMQLGLFGMFLGGRNRAGIMGYDEPPKPATLSNEWAGLIGQNFSEFMRAPWAILTPIIGYFVLILLVNMIKKELEGNLDGREVLRKYKNRRSVKLDPVEQSSYPDFQFVGQRKAEG